ncbi:MULTISPECIES: copper homeostasis membrane protein CopD [unclassified Pseudomonas]|jgi:putative copper resistance protein D|uniref:Copper resistance protein CopD n=1 Tax=Pseudomonas gorinensis TaxID=3240790 RepID=A0ACA7PAY7_9PSED|nr:MULTISPECIES: copper homeostasis membrane protein CopD [unclassified Pseudomonas]AHC37201.1 copper resistance protein CopD [Pseudomonas sp. TKP]MBL1309295.1 copper homeostasis membrane protein CopD [Pseudomonas sp.]PMX09423.1 copper resistance protein CopD [Pseudomonas sp. MPBC4-3]PMX44774.1 copper resistance protein CopD [Pseudomonas sp. FW301-21B01]PMY04433.1 copper resistance protein CopD [Pseudomonas sp. MPR-R5A]
MSELSQVALRFALYLDLMLLFGFGLFGLYGLNASQRTLLNFKRLMGWTAGLGMLLSVASLLSMTQAMSGASDWQALWPHLQMMLWQTDLGVAWCLRIVALVLAGCTTRLLPATVLGGVALVTLVWSGHGVMHEGMLGAWHIISDAAHLLAAGGWVGALAAFGLLLRRALFRDRYRVEVLAGALAGFERIGAGFVAVLIVTGGVNYLLVVGPNLDGINGSVYAILLGLKLGVFSLMLGLAALNRFHLVPFLQRSLAAGDTAAAGRVLRRSMALEFGAVVLILGLVAWLGTLAPG